MKKRTIISIILTIICVLATNSLWLIYKPMPVSFKMFGNGEYKVSIVLNKKDNNEFEKVKKASKKVELFNEEKKIKLSIKDVKYPKRLKLVMVHDTTAGGGQTLYVTGFQLNKEKLKIKREKDFLVKNATVKVADKKLYITPTNNENIEIIYKTPLKVRDSIKFEFGIFISILVLSFLLFYKLTSYLADFKNIQQASRIEIVFLTIFFIFLFIPMCHINNDEVSIQENRKLTKWQPLITKSGQINYTFGKNYDEWFNDRFNLRNVFISANTELKYNINQNYYTNGNVTLYKKKNFIYRGDYFGAAQIKKDKTNVLKQYVINLNKLQKYSEKHNIQLYILIAPRIIDFFDYDICDLRKNKPDPANEIIDYIRNNTNIKIIYPKEEMMEANKVTPVYFKTDQHWTKKGAYIGYIELMKEIKKDFPSVGILQESELTPFYDKKIQATWDQTFYEGRLYKASLGLPKTYSDRILDTDYLYYKNSKSKYLENNKKIKYSRNKNDNDEEFYYSYGLNKKVMLIAASYGQNLVEFLPYSFKNTLRLSDNHRRLKFLIYKPIIEDYKPDILILNIKTNSLHTFLNLYPNKYSQKGEEE